MRFFGFPRLRIISGSAVFCFLHSVLNLDVSLASCRRATCAMTRKKPAIVICEDFSLWLGNTSDSDSVVEPGELLGFGTGIFEEKVVSHSA